MTKDQKLVELQAQLTTTKEKLAKALQEQGEACGVGCDWHDNNAYDLATSLAETYQAMVNDIEQEIKTLRKSSPQGNKV